MSKLDGYEIKKVYTGVDVINYELTRDGVTLKTVRMKDGTLMVMGIGGFKTINGCRVFSDASGSLLPVDLSHPCELCGFDLGEGTPIITDSEGKQAHQHCAQQEQ